MKDNGDGNAGGESGIFNGLPLRRLTRGPCAGLFGVDSRDFAAAANRTHGHVLHACRAALRRNPEAADHIYRGRYRTKHGSINPRFVLTEYGCALALQHMKNRLGLDKGAFVPMLRVSFDRAMHGVVDPPIAEPAPDTEPKGSDSKIRPPEPETLFDGAGASSVAPSSPVSSTPRSGDAVVVDAVAEFRAAARDPVSVEPSIDLALSRRINAAVSILLSREANVPPHIRETIDTWNRARLDEAWELLRSWDDLRDLYAS